MAPNELYYFVPGQVILHLEHDDISDPKGVVGEWLQVIGEPWSQLTIQMDHQTITFPPSKKNKNFTSLVSTHVNEQDGELVDLFIQLYSVVEENNFSLPINDHISLHTVSPNWLMSSSPHQSGIGGPGSWPERAVLAYENCEKINFDFSHSQISPKLDNGKNVEVAILDTAPITECYMISKEETASLVWPVFDALNHHDLFQYLRNNLEIVPFDSVWQNFCFSLRDHNYLMPDHGLFVAGIIHTIAPEAHLHLYEVLNPYGVGCYETIASGLQKALHNPKRPLVINCSLVLNMPLLKLNKPLLNGPSRFPGFIWDHEATGLSTKFKDPILLDHLITSFQEIISQIDDSDVVVVAAAGNDYKKEIMSNRPSGRFPAAYQNIIGVGALPRNSLSQESGCYNPASYSNLCDQPPYADRPPYSGYVTLGGEPGSEGVLGVYIHQFPYKDGGKIKYHPNDTGWAWWAGTSFATPVISGLLAAGCNANWRGTGDAYSFLNQASGSNRTIDGERVIYVTQP